MSEQKAFFDAYHQIMDAMIDEARVVEEHHITVTKLVQQAKERGVSLHPETAWKSIRRRVAAGKLKSDGKRIDPETRKIVCVWVVVEEETT